ncbi:MAG: Rieske 2Fe-2S domain-containing protein [Acidobacteria bacterium]|nr:Rieske 2Fe-2S domain-containing protein [Acidobacteriota bacterium]
MQHDPTRPGQQIERYEWCHVDPGDLPVGGVTTVIAADRAIAITRTENGYGALDNRCPHQGGPLGDGQIEHGCLICPWHGYEYDPHTGAPPEEYGDVATAYEVEERDDGLHIRLPVVTRFPTVMDQMVDTMTEWGVDSVFGMVGHSNLGLADALRRAEEDGRLHYYGIRHEGAAAFAASAYGKLTGSPAACFSIAGPGATNLLTGLWDAKVDRAPILALTGQVQTQVLGPGAFQELPLTEAFSAVAEWTQTVLSAENATELMALAIKHAVINRDVAHLVFPDEIQELPGRSDQLRPPKEGRIAPPQITPPLQQIEQAITLLAEAQRPVIIAGHGARQHRSEIIALAEQIDAPIITTFKAKGLIADRHPLAAGVLGRSGTPVGSAVMGRSDVLLVLGASFSNHTGISERKPTIQVDFDRMTLGKFHPVDIPLWGEIATTVRLLRQALPEKDRPAVRADIAERWERWRAEKARRSVLIDKQGRMHPAAVFEVMTDLVPDNAVLPVDVGNNTYAFGHYFESGSDQDVIMSGYLGSIGFALPAAIGCWAATRGSRPIVSISGDGGLGQYLAEFTTIVKYDMNITHVVLNNSELGKISREQISAIRPVWQTDLVNPDFAEYARSCGAVGLRAETKDAFRDALDQALSHQGPALVEVVTSALDV